MSRDPLEEQEYRQSIINEAPDDAQLAHSAKPLEEVLGFVTIERNGVLYIREVVMDMPETFHQGDEVEIIARLKRKV